MPTCPGCERHIPYDELDVHQRHCDGISSSGPRRSLERLEQRVAALERQLARQLDGADVDFTTRLTSAEERHRPR